MLNILKVFSQFYILFINSFSLIIICFVVMNALKPYITRIFILITTSKQYIIYAFFMSFFNRPNKTADIILPTAIAIKYIIKLLLNAITSIPP